MTPAWEATDAPALLSAGNIAFQLCRRDGASVGIAPRDVMLLSGNSVKADVAKVLDRASWSAVDDCAMEDK